MRLNAAHSRVREATQAQEAFDATLKIARARVRTGLGSQLDELEARRGTLSARSHVVQARQEQASAWIALYRALGGGWDRQFAIEIKTDGQP